MWHIVLLFHLHPILNNEAGSKHSCYCTVYGLDQCVGLNYLHLDKHFLEKVPPEQIDWCSTFEPFLCWFVLPRALEIIALYGPTITPYTYIYTCALYKDQWNKATQDTTRMKDVAYYSASYCLHSCADCIVLFVYFAAEAAFFYIYLRSMLLIDA